ncbi:MAG: S8 family serine peptidase [Deltaproteobacteria bacterium]|nr:S8 family serine peptidase [Deltaproteobacteria bacterium]
MTTLLKSLTTALFITIVSFSFNLPPAAAETASGPPKGAPAFAPPCKPGFLPGQAKVPCRGIIAFIEGVTENERAQLVKKAGASLKFNFNIVNGSAVFVPDEATYLSLSKNEKVKSIIPDRVTSVFVKPESPGGKGGRESGQTVPSGVELIGAAPGALSVTGTGIGVAIIDTGIDMDHADLAVGSPCFTAYAGCNDGEGHGTHVAGIVAALDNDINVVGVAPQATPYAVKVLNDRGSGLDSAIIAGLEWVYNYGETLTPPIRVVNMSLGREGNISDNPLYHDAIKKVYESGISIVVAAGNDPGMEVSQTIPAAYAEVISVASTTAQDGMSRCKSYSGIIPAHSASYFSTDGVSVTLSAPGEKAEHIHQRCFIQSEGILSLKAAGGTTRKSGTSMAAPHVAGVIALMFEEANGYLEPEVVRSGIKNNAFLIGTAPLDSPVSSYTYDGIREGVISACGALASCP